MVMMPSVVHTVMMVMMYTVMVTYATMMMVMVVTAVSPVSSTPSPCETVSSSSYSLISHYSSCQHVTTPNIGNENKNKSKKFTKGNNNNFYRRVIINYAVI